MTKTNDGGPTAAQMKIRRRVRIDASPARGLSQEWVEWQVVGARGKVFARCDTEDEAVRKRDAMLAALNGGENGE